MLFNELHILIYYIGNIVKTLALEEIILCWVCEYSLHHSGSTMTNTQGYVIETWDGRRPLL